MLLQQDFYGNTIFIVMKADQEKPNFWNNFPALSIQNGEVPTQVSGKTYSQAPSDCVCRRCDWNVGDPD